jgi:hypothetical protein
LKTPEGWVRANLLFRTLSEPPRKGSLRESALMLLMMKLETIEHSRFRALSQIIIDQEKGVEAFEEYMKLAFPYLEAVKERDKEKLLRVLKREVAGGPLMITPMKQPMVQSRLQKRATARKKSREEMDRLYQRMGSTLPL